MILIDNKNYKLDKYRNQKILFNKVRNYNIFDIYFKVRDYSYKFKDAE